MTKEEAIKQLKENRLLCINSEAEPFAIAYDMAIKALEQEPCEDAISRKDILDCQYTIDENETLGISTRNVVNVDDILNAKPVQPNPKTGHWIFDEILDRNYYCSECKSMGVDYWDYCPYCGAKMDEKEQEHE